MNRRNGMLVVVRILYFHTFALFFLPCVGRRVACAVLCTHSTYYFFSQDFTTVIMSEPDRTATEHSLISHTKCIGPRPVRPAARRGCGLALGLPARATRHTRRRV